MDEAALDEGLEASFAELIEAIRVTRGFPRNLRAVAGLKPSQPAPVVFVTGRPELAAVLRTSEDGIPSVTLVSRLRPSSSSPMLQGRIQDFYSVQNQGRWGPLRRTATATGSLMRDLAAARCRK